MLDTRLECLGSLLEANDILRIIGSFDKYRVFTTDRGPAVMDKDSSGRSTLKIAMLALIGGGAWWSFRESIHYLTNDHDD